MTGILYPRELPQSHLTGKCIYRVQAKKVAMTIAKSAVSTMRIHDVVKWTIIYTSSIIILRMMYTQLCGMPDVLYCWLL